jgi:uncharacterized protein YceK
MACVAAVLACALSGCGTFVNCTSGREIYGGIKQDAQNGASHLAEAFSGPCPSLSQFPDNPSSGKQTLIRTFCAGCGVGMLALDLPVSAVADTLTLPITIPATLMKPSDNRKPPRRSPRSPAPRSAE